jgi:simple sugar transport system ATP-binding protein
MIGEATLPEPAARLENPTGAARLRVRGLSARNERGVLALSHLSLGVDAGEILGIAGVSGNGQRELVEVLAGQRDAIAGILEVNGRGFRPRRAEMRRERVYCLPEEPLHNACVAGMTLAENLAMREFDTPRFMRWRALVNGQAIIAAARVLIERFQVRPPNPTQPIGTLSGGNVQRSVLARELSGDIAVLIAADPCFGLDFAAIAEIRARIVEARNRGAAVLLVSSDLDEIFEIADRIAVMFDGRIVYEARIAEADRGLIGRRMAGQ